MLTGLSRTNCNPLRQPVSIGSDGVRLPTFSRPPQPQLYFDEYLLSLLRIELRKSPMDSSHGNSSPSDSIESVCRHFAPHHITDQFCSRALHLIPVPVAIGLNPPAGKGNPTQFIRKTTTVAKQFLFRNISS